MYEAVQTLTGVTSLLCAALLGLIVLCRHINEGLVIKAGLILMTLGFFASGLITLKGFDTLSGLWHAGLLIRIGLLVVLTGFGWRVIHQRRKESACDL